MATPNLGTEECLALLRDASLRPESIAEEMECAGQHPPTPADIGAARSLLDELGAAPAGSTEAGKQAAAVAKGIGQLPEVLALTVLRAVGVAARQDVLREVALGSGKALAKEAKRELQRLKQKGVKVDDLAPAGAPILKPQPEAEAAACYASSIDAYGERAVWYARSSRVGVEVVQAVISDVRGILAVDALGLSRRSWREFVKRMPRQSVVTTVEVPREHARALIAEAAEDGARNGFTPAQGYQEALAMLGPPREPSSPPQLDFGPGGEASAARAGAALFEDSLFGAWIPEEEALRAFSAKVEEIAQSQLYVDEAQRAAAFDRLADEAAAAYFTPQRRARYARRLSEMARVLEAEARPERARTALAVSRQIGQEGGEGNPFCRALFAHALGSLRRAQEQEKAQASGGRPPGGPPAGAGALFMPR
ncbi:MAG: hypothetical protein NVSMB23_11720 [Myxococcales bacterium]